MSIAPPISVPIPPARAEKPVDLPFPPRGQLPADLLAIPIGAEQLSASLKICLIVRRTADPVQGHLLLKRDLLDARVYAGCVTDGHGPTQMLEVWVQSLTGLTEASRRHSLTGEALDNAVMDGRWARLFDVAAEAWPGSILATGFEASDPRPTFFDVESGRPIHPPGWTLCRDETVLAGAGLPPFTTTLHRYLVDDSRTRFIPVSDDAPRNDLTVEYTSVLPNDTDLVPFNPAAGRLLVRAAGNLRFKEFNELLSGKKYDGSKYGLSRHRFGPLQSLNTPAGGFMFPPEATTGGTRLLETLLLKLQLLAGMVEEAGRFTAATQRPLLDLQPANFSIRLDDTAMHLPALWTSRVMLTSAGDAIPLKLPQGETKHHYCLPGPRVATSIYQPAIASRGPVSGFGQVYLSATSDVAGAPAFDGMLTVVDPIRPTVRDIIRLRIPVNGHRVDLYVKLMPDGSPSPSLLKFKSVPEDRLTPHRDGLEALVGVPMQEIAFEFYPLLGSACDVYSLAVLGVEVLLASAENSHAERFRDLLVLASRVRESYSPAPLEERLAAVFADKPDTPKGLGPQFLVSPAVDPVAAMKNVTPELWMSVLSLLIRMLPGHGKDSLLADFGDTLNGRPQGVYDVVLPELIRLMQRTRGMLLGEWGMNRAVGQIVDEFRRPGKTK